MAQNPFEIKERVSNNGSIIEAPSVTPETTMDEQAEIGKDVTTSQTEAEQQEETSVSASSNLAAEQIATATPRILNDKNPFNVTHIPLRRSTITKSPKARTPVEKTTKPSTSPTNEAKPTSSIASTNEITQEKKKDFFRRNLPLLFLFISFLILALVVTNGRKTISNIVRSIYNENYLKQIKTQSDDGRTFGYVILYILFIINASLFFFLILSDHIELSSSKMFLYIMAVILTVYNVRHSVLFYLGMIFKDLKKETSEYSFTVQIFNVVVGLILIPINLLLAFGPESFFKPLLFIGVAAVILMYLLRSIRGVLLTRRYLVMFPFHFFLYLCTCEIGPLLVCYRYVQQHFV